MFLKRFNAFSDEDYFFYHVDGGVEDSVESLIRLRRQAGPGSSPAAVATSSSSASSSTTLPPTSQVGLDPGN